MMHHLPILVKPFPQHTLRWWINRRSQIDVSPGYQREGDLWSESDKAYLIDSIINGFDVPKIYLADFTSGNSVLNEKKLPYAVIDGKQRLEAITEFFEGKLRLNQTFRLLDDPMLSLGGYTYSDLADRFPLIADRFDEFELQMMSVITDDPSLVQELFVRLNKSKPLTGAEVRNAVDAPTAEIVRDIANHVFFKSYIAFNTKRGQGQNLAAKLLFLEFSGKAVSTKKKDLDKFVSSGSIDHDDVRKSYVMLVSVLNKMGEIFLPKDPLLTSSGLIPVYYWFVRQTNADLCPLIRKFLLEFEIKRRSNRDLVKAKPRSKLIDSTLSEYDLLNRSTNDSLSIERRYEILANHFDRFA
jgi:hypothetical protein